MSIVDDSSFSLNLTVLFLEKHSSRTVQYSIVQYGTVNKNRESNKKKSFVSHLFILPTIPHSVQSTPHHALAYNICTLSVESGRHIRLETSYKETHYSITIITTVTLSFIPSSPLLLLNHHHIIATSVFESP